MNKLERDNRKTFLFLSWRDIKAPKKGGAEVFTHEMLKRIDQNKYRIIHISPLYEGAKEIEVIDNISYLRMGGTLSVILEARRYYKDNKDNIDYVVDQCNTHRFFTPLWVDRKKRIFFIHQFTREIWDINMKRPFNHLGRISESWFSKLSNKDLALTVSNSTREDLIGMGFDDRKITVLPEGIDFRHWKREDFLKKEDDPTFIYVGRYSNYKGIDKVVRAYLEIRKKYSNAKLWIVGKKNEEYIKDVLMPILGGESKGVEFLGFVSDEKKLELMSRAHCLIFPSIREGWGLIITEAAAVGTPSIGYDSPGIRDALNLGNSGYMCRENTENELERLMFRVIEEDDEYKMMRERAYDYSLNFHWSNTARAFENFARSLGGVEDGMCRNSNVNL